MKQYKVTEVDIGEEYLIHKGIEEASFADNYRLVSRNLDFCPKPKDLMIAFFLSFPKTFKLLLNTREVLAGKLGLKTAPKIDEESRLQNLYNFKGNIGDSVAIFEVLDKTKNELLTGQKDDHLDFKLSFIVKQDEGKVILELPTTVILNNKVGRVYFSIVKPIHKFYLKRILKRMEINLMHKKW